MDDFEARLSQGLSTSAATLPEYQPDVAALTRRGRNRRWVSRGAGALSALLLVAASAVVLDQTRSEPEDSVATEGPGPAVDDTNAAGPAPVRTVEQIDVFDDLIVATGWGVGLAEDGQFEVLLSCCQGDPTAWRSAASIQTGGIDIRPGAVRAFDDRMGGFVYASESAILWQSAELLPDNRAVVLDFIPIVDGLPNVTHELVLHDVDVLDGVVVALYEKTLIDAEGAGTTDLIAWDLDQGTSEIIESSTWSTSAQDRRLYRSVGASGSVIGVVRSDGSGTCTAFEMIDRAGSPIGSPGVVADDPERPGCSEATLHGAALDDDGRTVVISQARGDQPLAVMYDMVAEAAVRVYELPSSAVPWSEIDVDQGRLIVSTQSALPESANTTDRTVLVDADGPVLEISLTGAPTWVRTPVVGTRTPLTSADPLWFALGDLRIASVDSSPTGTVEAEPASSATETPTTEVPLSGVPDQARLTTGALENILDSALFLDDGACWGSAGCLGDAFSIWELQIASVWGDEDTNAPEAQLEGELPDGRVWIDSGLRLTISLDDGTISEIRITPETNDAVFEPPLTIGQLLQLQGSPAEVFNGIGEGAQFLWIGYDTTAARVDYGYIDLDVELGADEAARVLRAPGDLSLPPEYDELRINALWIRAAG